MASFIAVSLLSVVTLCFGTLLAEHLEERCASCVEAVARRREQADQ
jgi:hypothetical protein